ncbi:hypothetical protein [Acidovorax sp. BL-A-41-H1]|uniref:hypothetical protein n=1 Tax=Acidovorax sp. BL-A-41-H1 TaxID=3421102 RepID=UPI003F7AFEFA
MDLTRITYEGRKAYRESHSGNTWAPGDTKLVPAVAAEKLLRFVEFKRASEAKKADKPADTDPTDNTPTDSEQEAAMVVQQEADRVKEQERLALEQMLLTVQAMDKSALEEYARKYEVELDKRLGVNKLRAEVSTLVEQFGAR